MATNEDIKFAILAGLVRSALRHLGDGKVIKAASTLRAATKFANRVMDDTES